MLLSHLLSWLGLFPHYKLSNLNTSIFDYSPILLVCNSMRWMGRTKRFRFENFWLSKPNIFELIKDSWDSSKGKLIGDKISLCAWNLVSWSRIFNTNFRRMENQIHNELEDV